MCTPEQNTHYVVDSRYPLILIPTPDEALIFLRSVEGYKVRKILMNLPFYGMNTLNGWLYSMDILSSATCNVEYKYGLKIVLYLMEQLKERLPDMANIRLDFI